MVSKRNRRPLLLATFLEKRVVGQIPTMAFKTMGHDCLSLHKGQVLLCKRFIFLTYFYIQICYLHICSKETFKMAKDKDNILLHKKVRGCVTLPKGICGLWLQPSCWCCSQGPWRTEGNLGGQTFKKPCLQWGREGVKKWQGRGTHNPTTFLHIMGVSQRW